MSKARYVFSNEGSAELARKLVRVLTADNAFYNPITIERVDNAYGQWVINVPNLPQDMLFNIAESISTTS